MDPQKKPSDDNNEPEIADKRADQPKLADDISLIDESQAEHTPGTAPPEVGTTVSPGAPPIDRETPTEQAAGADTTPLDAPEQPATDTETVSADDNPTPSSATEPAPEESSTPEDAQEPAPAAPAHRKKKGLIVGLIVILAVLLLGGGAALAYFASYLPNRPENVLKAALANSFSPDQVNSTAFNGSFKSVNPEQDFTLNGTFGGAMDNEGKLDLNVSLDLMVTTLNVDVRSADGKSVFLRASGLAGLAQFMGLSAEAEEIAPYLALVDGIENQWYEINESLVTEATGGTLATSKEDLTKLAQLYDEHSFLRVAETLPDEEINGVASYHYKVTADAQQLDSFIQAAKDTDFDSIDLTDVQWNATRDALKDAYADNPFDVWIAKGAKRFTQLMFSVTDDNGTTTEVRITMTSYNEPVEVERPEGARQIIDLLGDFFGAEAQGLFDPAQFFEEGQQPAALSL